MTTKIKNALSLNERREQRTLHSLVTGMTESERKKLMLEKHVSFIGLFNYHDKLDPVSSKEYLKILQNESTLNKNIAALLYRGAIGDKSALEDMAILETGSLGIKAPILIQEVALLDGGNDKIQTISHRISLHQGEFKTTEANEARELLHKYEIGGQFLSDKIEKIKLDKSQNNNVIDIKFR